MNNKENTVIFKSEELQDESTGLRFALPALGELATGFVVRFHGRPYAYVNKCAHVPVELDWNPGEFFTAQKDYLICATHGAHYQPDTGFCVMGPCKGKRLKAIQVVEQNQQIIINIDTAN
jgi:nitrite reductase/ring-hydroxylating ferredoxin subunit